MNDKQKEAIREISFGNFLYLQVDMTLRKLTLDAGSIDRGKDFRRNFVTLLASTCLRGNQKGQVNYLVQNVLVDLSKLCYIDDVVFKLRSVPCQFPTLNLGWDRGYLDDSLDKTTVTDEEEQVNEEECHNKSVKDEAKAEDQTGVSRIQMKELIPGVCTLLKRVGKVAVESTTDALISDRPKKSKSGTPVVSQDSYELEGSLIKINSIEKHFVVSRDTVHDFSQFTPPSFSLGVSQEEKEALPKGVVIVDS
ncbi:hypothetical protein Cgig2_013002 [Carnegiea gigantea]|uniref:Uncharacterized protein n=1 Tax=Carnegiea gigantea TaxID=171969 RepID=A0A9Q1QEW9_9CARY|nr:hypothetical protein Cgig2_013002 [Carnegiea gigantea]